MMPGLAWPLTLFGATSLVILWSGTRLARYGDVIAARTGLGATWTGLVVVAAVTSLPELVTAVIAALKKQGDVAFGNIIGSNIYNTFGILGITAAVHPLEVPVEIIEFDIWVMLAATVMLLFFAVSGWRVSRREGAALFGLYILYIGVLAWGAL